MLLRSACVALTVVLAGCAPVHSLARHEVPVTRSVSPSLGITWFGPEATRDEAALDRWRHAVGPPVLDERAEPGSIRGDELTVVSWNVANGDGDLAALARTLPRGPVVLLLQEAYRGGPEVPGQLRPDAAFAGRLGGAEAGPHAQEIESVADALDLTVYYVPSMRNGGPASDEDRGNAILSNLKMTDLLAVELPFERQRRVAIAATVHGQTRAGIPWTLRVASAHLDNMAGPRRGWLGGEYGRTRQARALRELLSDGVPTVLGADLNTWFGFSERAYVETARAFPQTRVTDGRATFRGLLRLDHLFFRLPERWNGAFRRAEQRFGSDHYPLVGTLRVS